jgi:UDP-N-acetylmuramoylalanine--D-glutamate ligase
MLTNERVRSGMHVVVLGLGVSGRAAVSYLLACGARVSVSESRALLQMKKEELDFLNASKVGLECGGHSVSLLHRADMIMVSPGVPFDLPILNQARERGIAVVGELAVGGTAIDAQVVAISGTNGKTTVTSLVGELLESAGKKVFVGGNIGTPIFDYLLQPTPVDVVVLEVSSFQLESCGGFRPDVALLLNVTPDHLDRHGDLAGYTAAKRRIFINQRFNDIAILNGDDPVCRQIASGFTHKKYLLFGHGADCRARISPDRVVVGMGGTVETFSLTGTAMAGNTGALNVAAAVLAAKSLGCRADDIRKGLKQFTLGPHRLTKVCELNGVCYYDDSKATNTGAVLSALDHFTGGVILIAGGRDKGDDYALLRKGVEDKVKRLVLIGEAAEKIAAKLQGTAKILYAATMEEAVRTAAEEAVPGDTVLLSPSCSSFDMFDNYGHRGKAFIAAVERLAKTAKGPDR